MRGKYESVQKQTGRPVPELEDLIELPEALTFVWMYFIELHNGRTGGMGGVNPIQYSEILSYFTLMRIEPSEWEVQLIKKLDGVALQHYAEDAAKQQEKAKQKKPRK